MKTALPDTWLIVLIAGLTLLTETVYTPSLPDIAHALHASESLVEYTLTIYLFGFGIGALFWGKLSDKMGRKPCILGGLFIFVLGCVGCYLSPTITALMISRLVQGFGGSIGSVLGQAIARDAFQGAALGRVYSAVGGALMIFPAIGPVIGGLIAEQFGWPPIFLFLILFAIVLMILVIHRLPETHHIDNRGSVSISDVLFRMLRDKKVITFSLIVGMGNGMLFSYFAEGSFYLIRMLGLSPSQYGYSFIGIAVSGCLGGILSKKLHSSHTSQTILEGGLWIVLSGALLFSTLILWHVYWETFSHGTLIAITLFSQTIIAFGHCMAMSNALALALTDYRSYIGTASSLFGFFYYLVISLVTLGMGALHNGTLLPLPLYFLGLTLGMITIKRLFLTTDGP